MPNKKVFVILGPTSSGKTSIAIELCKKFNGEIISADSRQIFKYMDIGTGKIPVGSDIKVEKKSDHWVLDGVKVWAYDLADPNQYFSGYDFSIFALRKAREILDSGKNVFLVGGTGFYIDLFTGRVKPSNVLPDEELRSSLSEMSLDELGEKLEKLNPEIFEKIDKQNKHRLIRAIERELSEKVNEKPLPYLDCEFSFIGLRAPREVLYKKADLWNEKVWENGLIDEVRELISKGYGSSSKLQGLVYKQVVQFLNEKISKDEAMTRSKFDLHKYIKRQETYFKKNTDIEWTDVSEDGYKKIIYNKVERELSNE